MKTEADLVVRVHVEVYEPKECNGVCSRAGLFDDTVVPMLLRALTEGLPVTVVQPAGGHSASTHTGVSDVGRGGAVRICDITEDSRTVMPGSLFVARMGDKSDGNAFINAAIKAGAVAVLSDDPGVGKRDGSRGGGVSLLYSSDLPSAVAVMAERFYGGPSSKLAMVGITGTKGKTTCAYLVHQLLNGWAGGSMCRAGLIGTVCIDDGVEVAAAQLTTPPALELSRTIARMVEAGCTACVMETSSHALDQGRVAGLDFRVGVFTNLGHDHLDYHANMEEYARAKARLFEALPPGERGGLAVVNCDDRWCGEMLKGCVARVVRVSMRARQSAATPAPDCTARVLRESPAGTYLDITGPFTGGVPAELFLPLIGEHNVMNALQAGCVAHALGMPSTAVLTGLGLVSAPPGRMQPVTGPDAPLCVYVDYAHTPDSLAAVLRVARRAVEAEKKGGRVIALFGCGGDRDSTKRPRMGAAAGELADVIIVTSDNPRTEDPNAIIKQIVAGIPPAALGKSRVIHDRGAAIAAAVAEALPGDVVLLAGKGHEDYQIIADPQLSSGGGRGTIKVHFDDREVAITALKARGMPVINFIPGRLIAPFRPSLRTAGHHHTSASTAVAPTAEVVRHGPTARADQNTGDLR